MSKIILLQELYQATISIHHAKAGYDYPVLRLPHTFSKLAGLRTKIYQIVHEGALAFLVVVSMGVTKKKQQLRVKKMPK